MGTATMKYHIFGLETWTRKVQEFTSRRSAIRSYVFVHNGNNVARDFPPEKKDLRSHSIFRIVYFGRVRHTFRTVKPVPFGSRDKGFIRGLLYL